jgi:hypothetical protein
MSEKNAYQVHNSQFLINSLNYLRENPHSWDIIKSSVNETYIEGLYSRRHDKSGNPSNSKKTETKDFMIIKSSQGQKWNEAYFENS